MIPMTWVLRYTVERVEIDNNHYRHYFVTLPWYFPTEWAVDEITKITFGADVEGAITTLSVWRGWRQDMIAYWARTEFREKLFEAIQTHLAEIGSQVPSIKVSGESDRA